MIFARRLRPGSIGTSEPGEAPESISQRHGAVIPLWSSQRVRCLPCAGSRSLPSGGENPQVEVGCRQGGHETHCRGIAPAMESPTPQGTPPEM